MHNLPLQQITKNGNHSHDLKKKREKKKSFNSKTKEEPFDYRWLYTEI